MGHACDAPEISHLFGHHAFDRNSYRLSLLWEALHIFAYTIYVYGIFAPSDAVLP